MRTVGWVDPKKAKEEAEKPKEEVKKEPKKKNA